MSGVDVDTEQVATRASENVATEQVASETTREVIVRGFNKYIKPNELNSMISMWTYGTSIKIAKHKKTPTSNRVIITLEDGRMVETFLKMFEDGTRKCTRGGVMRASRVTEKDDLDNNENGDRRASENVDTGQVASENVDTEQVASENVDTTEQVAASENTQIRHWDYTTRKVIVRGFHKYIKPNELNTMITMWTYGTPIKIAKQKKPPTSNWVIITLEDDKMVEPFLKIFEDGTRTCTRGGVMRASRATDDLDNNVNRNGTTKRKGDNETGEREGSKKPRTIPEECVKTPDEVRDKLTGLWRLSYEKQLTKKTRNMKKCLRKISSEMKNKFRVLRRKPVYEWIEKNLVPMDPIISAPKKFEYRNKSELTFGYAHNYAPNGAQDTAEVDLKKIIKTPAVGFMAAGWSGGVSKPHCLQNIPDAVCGIADIVNKFLCDSPVPPYNSRVHQGIWRYLTIRTSDRTKECMVIITHAPSTGGIGKRDNGADDYSAVFESEKERLTKMLTAGDIPMPVRDYPESHNGIETGETEKPSTCAIGVTSLFFQEYDGLSNPLPEHPVQHAYGKEFLEEKLLQCKFQISPGAFFQVTTEGAEVLYNVVVEKVREVADKPSETVLFDVCCGTGTIGLTCLKEGAVGKVVGIDISKPAIEDAMANVARNDFPTTGGVAKFVASRAEFAMNEEIGKVEKDCPIVAVVDPSREGLHKNVCIALRNRTEIQRIVYVSCNPTGSLIKDAVMLCTPQTKKYKGLPFKPTFAQPVDMFPQTDHCELVLVFDRMSWSECNEGKDCKNDAVPTTVEGAKDDIVPDEVQDGKDCATE